MLAGCARDGVCVDQGPGEGQALLRDNTPAAVVWHGPQFPGVVRFKWRELSQAATRLPTLPQASDTQREDSIPLGVYIFVQLTEL